MPWNDNAVPYASRKVDLYSMASGGTSGSASVWTTKKGTYAAENISVNRPQFVGKRYSEVRAPNGAFGTDDFVEGSATLQYADGSAKAAIPGDGFNVTFDTTIGGENFVVTSAGHAESQGDFKKQNITFQKLIAGTVTATV